jgi:hypothetical protein
MHSMSRSKGQARQSYGHRSGNLSIVEHDLDLKLPRSQITTVTNSAKYAGSERSNSSEERILPAHGDGIVCTTEVSVSRAQDVPQEKSTSTSVPKLGRMGSLSGMRINADDRV